MAKSPRTVLTGLLHLPKWHETPAKTGLCHSQRKQPFKIGNESTNLFFANLLQASSCVLYGGGDISRCGSHQPDSVRQHLVAANAHITFTEATNETWLYVGPWARIGIIILVPY